jgi:hypothetical protein
MMTRDFDIRPEGQAPRNHNVGQLNKRYNICHENLDLVDAVTAATAAAAATTADNLNE